MKKILVGIVSLLILTGIVSLVMAADDTAPTTATVTVNSFLSVTVDDATLAFSTMDPSETDKKPLLDPLVATIGAETNVDTIYVKTKADDANFADNGTTFPVSNMEWSLDGSTGWTDYTTIDATVCSGLSASGTCSIYHELDIPDATLAGSYDVGITITATTSA